MEIDRVKEIIDSPYNIQVLYNNHSVWINGLNETEKLVEVRILDTKKHVFIPADDLVDSGKVINKIRE